VLGSYDYISSRLTGTLSVEQNWALESGFMDLAESRLDADLVALGGIQLESLPDLRASRDLIGEVTAKAAAETGLKSGTSVVAGCADHIASAFVAGAAQDGDLVVKFGGAGDIMLSCSTAVTDPRLFIDFHIVPGGMDAQRYAPADSPPTTDLVLVGRLVEIKRIDIFLRAIKIVTGRLPDLRATIVGDGALRRSLEQLARDLGVDKNVEFVGHQRDVATWLKRARLFVLTSDSEGLALSLMEAMLCGLPAVVSDVGDLADLVEPGSNGYLVASRSPDAFAERLTELLVDEPRRRMMSSEARRSSLQYEFGVVARRWDSILAGTNASTASHPSSDRRTDPSKCGPEA